MKKVLMGLVIGFLSFGIIGIASATPIFSKNATVDTITNSATFDSIDTGDSLLNYAEDGIIVSTNDLAVEGFDAFNTGVVNDFHYGSGGNYTWIDIFMADSSVIESLDFMIGDGWLSTTTNLLWETFLSGSSTGFGDVVVDKGSTVGWTDDVGFDRIRVAANFQNIDSFGDFQAIAIDNVRIGTTTPSAPIPEPATMLLFGLGILGIAGVSRKEQK